MTAITFWAMANGLGDHADQLTPSELGVQFKVEPIINDRHCWYKRLNTLKLIIGCGVTWLIATVCCKMSMLSLYSVIFSSQPLRYAIWAVMALVGVYFIAIFCAIITYCHPISQAWDPVPGGYCKKLGTEELLSIIFNIFLDTLIVILPMPSLWSLKMAARNKITVSAMFGIGLL
jgi:hypothetical protein